MNETVEQHERGPGTVPLAEAPATTPPDFYIPAASSVLERHPRTLKYGDTFAMFDHYGDLGDGAANPEGIYHEDTRYLSQLHLEIEGRRPLLLSSTVQNNNSLLTVDLTNPDIYFGEERMLPRDSIHIMRSKYLWSSACYEALVCHNYSSETRAATISLRYESDFRDLFEVRGHRRPRRGTVVSQIVGANRVVLRYTGLDERVRETVLAFSPAPVRLTDREAEWRITLRPGSRCVIFMTVSCGASLADYRFLPNLRRAQRARVQASRRQANVSTSNEIFNELLCRSVADLVMLTTDTDYGPYPYAGIPWFSTAFGRDGIITAIQMLAIDPELARGVLQLLAATQANATDPARDAEPGKILHETRRGEMAVLREVPFGLYYGSVDATPLFVLLAGLYWERTADIDTLRKLWPNVLAALQWIDRHGDLDGDGFVEYQRKTPTGLANQGWKDSEDSVFHADGGLARGSIALCEVQAYVYAAKTRAATLARALGDAALAGRLEAQAEALRVRFEEAFWMEDLGYYALALDGEKRPCRVITSNAGHALFCGIAAPERAAQVARRLMSNQMFCGWGIRTVSSDEKRYNPMSYHNGSVWPHDNALVAMGLARYGHMDEADRVLTALFEASTHMELRRLPELFCGVRRRPERSPTAYPVACSPQAWASAAPFGLLTAALGLELDAHEGKVRFRHPRLPACLNEIELKNLRLGSTTLDVLLHRRGNGVAVNVIEKKGQAGVEVLL
ncbi:MAG: glycogen debranching N-terminal domain-containing protein [Rhodospirillaceae bacterium]